MAPSRSKTHSYLVSSVLDTSPGDANLDGRFDSEDLVHVFIAGQYEDGVAANSGWATGDWNCDGEFDSEDVVEAFRFGGYSSAAAPRVSPLTRLAAGGTHEVTSDRSANADVYTMARSVPASDPSTPVRGRLLSSQAGDLLFAEFDGLLPADRDARASAVNDAEDPLPVPKLTP